MLFIYIFFPTPSLPPYSLPTPSLPPTCPVSSPYDSLSRGHLSFCAWFSALFLLHVGFLAQMAPPDSRERRNACYGFGFAPVLVLCVISLFALPLCVDGTDPVILFSDQFQPILTRGLNSSQRDIRAASAYFHPDAVNQARVADFPGNSGLSSVNLERFFEDPQHQFGLREGLPRSSSYSSSSWEDDSVPDTENFEGDEPERGTAASNDPQQSSAPDFSDEQIDSVLGLWERRSKRWNMDPSICPNRPG